MISSNSNAGPRPLVKIEVGLSIALTGRAPMRLKDALSSLNVSSVFLAIVPSFSTYIMEYYEDAIGVSAKSPYCMSFTHHAEGKLFKLRLHVLVNMNSENS